MAKLKKPEADGLSDFAKLILAGRDPSVLAAITEEGNKEDSELSMGPAAFLIAIRIATALERLVRLEEFRIGLITRDDLERRR